MERDLLMNVELMIEWMKVSYVLLFRCIYRMQDIFIGYLDMFIKCSDVQIHLSYAHILR